MSYTPTEWQTGDTITAEKLNNMEDGIENANEPFIVTLTPTAQDYSGTMDKTVAEINAAYEAGRKIVFRVYSSAARFNEVEVTVVYKDGSYTYPSFNAYLIVVADSVGFDGIIFAFTGTSDDSTKNTYSTTVYPLTPMT